MAAGQGLSWHHWLLTPAKDTSCLFSALWLQKGTQVEQMFKGPCSESEEVGQYGLEEQLVDLPD